MYAQYGCDVGTHRIARGGGAHCSAQRLCTESSVAVMSHLNLCRLRRSGPVLKSRSSCHMIGSRHLTAQTRLLLHLPRLRRCHQSHRLPRQLRLSPLPYTFACCMRAPSRTSCRSSPPSDWRRRVRSTAWSAGRRVDSARARALRTPSSPRCQRMRCLKGTGISILAAYSMARRLHSLARSGCASRSGQVLRKLHALLHSSARLLTH